MNTKLGKGDSHSLLEVVPKAEGRTLAFNSDCYDVDKQHSTAAWVQGGSHKEGEEIEAR